MSYELNEYGQAVGLPVKDWISPPAPYLTTFTGRFCRLEPLSAERHGEQLWSAFGKDPTGSLWTYLPNELFTLVDDIVTWINLVVAVRDADFLAIVDVRSDAAVGVAAYLRINPPDGTIEVGYLCFSPELQRTPAATEAMYLMMQYVFDLGYRRYEWKCNALNLPSRRAAQRLGFSFEGVWRNARVENGRNRDTAWFAMTDHDWPAVKAAFTQWLDATNFNESGKQKTRLSELTRPLLFKINGC
jgi:RimJ/RimL family protein N-acetyltransferase